MYSIFTNFFYCIFVFLILIYKLYMANFFSSGSGLMRLIFCILMFSFLLVGCGESVEDKVLLVVNGGVVEGGVVYVEPAVDKGEGDMRNRGEVRFRVVGEGDDWVVQYYVEGGGVVVEEEGRREEWDELMREEKDGDGDLFAERARERIFGYASELDRGGE